MRQAIEKPALYSVNRWNRNSVPRRRSGYWGYGSGKTNADPALKSPHAGARQMGNKEWTVGGNHFRRVVSQGLSEKEALRLRPESVKGQPPVGSSEGRLFQVEETRPAKAGRQEGARLVQKMWRRKCGWHSESEGEGLRWGGKGSCPWRPGQEVWIFF